MNWKKLYRIYHEEGLTVRKRGGRKRAVGTRTPMAIPQGPNQRWSLDFVSDSLSCGRRFRILNVIDDFSRECLAAVVDTSLSGDRVTRELDRIAEMRGYPDEALPSFRRWFRSQYLTTKFPKYILAKANVLDGGKLEAQQIAEMYNPKKLEGN